MINIVVPGILAFIATCFEFIADGIFMNPNLKNKVKHFFSLWCAWTVICGLCVLFFIQIY